MMQRMTEAWDPDGPPAVFPPDGDRMRFARTYLNRRGLDPDDGRVLLVERAVRKYRGPMPVAWRDLERFVERVLTPEGPDPR